MQKTWKAVSLATLLGAGLSYVWVQWFEGNNVGTTPLYAQQKLDAQVAKNQISVQADQLSAAFREVAKSLKPSVVSIKASTEGRQERRTRRTRPDFPRGFEEFFGEGFDFEMPMPRGGESQGSGFIVSEDGYILTNNHVVAGADKVLVNLSDNRSLEAKIVGTDPDSDIAVIKVNAKGLVAAAIGDSDAMQEGDWVIAIGSPFGLKHTITAGIVSAVNRNSVDSGQAITNYDNFIQTDAAINPGNSGGPLLNLRGEVIGINTAIASESGAFNGVGFAIPSNMAKDALKDIVESGRVIRGFVGAGLSELTPTTRDQLGIDSSVQGALIDQVYDGGPAAKAGLRPNDLVVAINGKPVQNVAGLRLQVAAMSPGDKANFDIIRDGKSVKITAVIEEQTKEKLAAMGGKRVLENLGIEVEELTPQDARDLGIQEGGVLVSKVNRDSPLAQNLRPGEAIVAVNRSPVSSVADFVKAVSQSKGGLRLVIRNPQSTRVLTIQ